MRVTEVSRRRPGGSAHVRRRASRPVHGRDPDLVRFLADSTPVLAGGRAILLQIADPVVATGVRRHSDFASRPQERLAHTLAYVYAGVLGTPADASTASASVQRAHHGVAGADEVDRQLWVAATLFDSAMRAHEAFGTEPARAGVTAQAVLDAYRPIGTSLRVPADRWPDSVASFDAYWQRTLEGLRVGDDAKSVARDLLHPVAAPWWVRAAMPLVRIVTVGMLPDVVRAQYGFAWGPREVRRYRRAVSGVRLVRAALPAALLRVPGPLLLRAMRRHPGR